MFKLISTWSPASVLNMKMWILKMTVPQAKLFWIFEILHFETKNWQKLNWPPPYKIYSPHPTPPIIGQPTHKSKNILTSFKNTKFQNSNSPLLTLVRVHTMYIAFHWIKILSKNNFKFQLFCISIFGILRLSSFVVMFIF